MQTKPFVKWVGGKRQLLPILKDNLPKSFNNYFEPFLGGGALFFSLKSTFHETKKVYLNDLNTELINTYNVVKNSPDELIEALTVHSKNNSSDYFYIIRALDRTDNFNELSDITRAARFIYLNKTCFNGLYRVNQKNQMNAPYGRYKHPNIINKEVILADSDYLKNTIITNSSYEEPIKFAKENDFVYFDSPYASFENKNNFKSYTQFGFDDDKQIELAENIKQLSNKNVLVMASNAYTPLTKELYKDFNTQIIPAKRSINSNGLKRGAVKEILITNY